MAHQPATITMMTRTVTMVTATSIMTTAAAAAVAAASTAATTTTTVGCGSSSTAMEFYHQFDSVGKCYYENQSSSHEHKSN